MAMHNPTSSTCPAWSPQVPADDRVLPLLYLHGLSTSDFGPALEQFRGSSAGLSTTTIHPADRAVARRGEVLRRAGPLGHRLRVYLWVDGIHLKVRLEAGEALPVGDDRGARRWSARVSSPWPTGYRESWADLLRSCRRRGMTAPVLAVGDGALGFWKAVREVFPTTREQRCWFHKRWAVRVPGCADFGSTTSTLDITPAENGESTETEVA